MPAELVKLLGRQLKRAGFKRFAKAPPKRIGLEQIGDVRRPAGGVRTFDRRKTSPRLDVRTKVEPGRTDLYALRVDLKGTAPGEAQVLTIEQLAGKTGEGGTTVIFIRQQ